MTPGDVVLGICICTVALAVLAAAVRALFAQRLPKRRVVVRPRIMRREPSQAWPCCPDEDGELIKALADEGDWLR